MLKLEWPCKGEISSPFGWRIKPKFGWHSGIDLAVPIGTEIKSAYKGVVVFAGDRGKYGNAIILHHPTLGNVWTLYAHLSQIRVQRFYWVEGGIIALSGNTGYSTGPHLHFEVRTGFNGVLAAKNPIQYLT